MTEDLSRTAFDVLLEGYELRVKERDEAHKLYGEAISVIDRLIAHLDFGESGDWLQAHCFAWDHELFDDVMALRRPR